MKVNVIALKKVVEKKSTKESITIFEYYLMLDNGSKIRINPYSYEDKKKNTIRNDRELRLVATIVDDFDELKKLPF